MAYRSNRDTVCCPRMNTGIVRKSNLPKKQFSGCHTQQTVMICLMMIYANEKSACHNGRQIEYGGKEMKANRIVLLSLLMLSILVSGCGTSAPNSSETYESTIVETTETIQMPEAVYEFPVMVSEDRGLTISLHLKELEDFSAKEIRKIEVYDGDQLLQIITKVDISEVTDYAWDGLFLNESNTIGLPDVRDLNFDGAEDFGLLAVFAYPQNVPYSYFFWNAEKALFEYQFTAFGPGWLQIDDSEKCLVEVSNEGMETNKKYFSFDLDGNIVTGNQTTSENSTVTDNQESNENMLMQVLENKVPFYSESSRESSTMAEYCGDESTRLGFEVAITRYAFVDMDGNGIQEAVVDFQFGENSQVMCMVLKWDSNSETVYGTEFYYRQMNQIKEDGSFAYSGGGDNDGWAKLRWENNSWVTLKVEDGDQKADVQWYSYPPALD